MFFSQGAAYRIRRIAVGGFILGTGGAPVPIGRVGARCAPMKGHARDRDLAGTDGASPARAFAGVRVGRPPENTFAVSGPRYGGVMERSTAGGHTPCGCGDLIPPPQWTAPPEHRPWVGEQKRGKGGVTPVTDELIAALKEAGYAVVHASSMLAGRRARWPYVVIPRWGVAVTVGRRTSLERARDRAVAR